MKPKRSGSHLLIAAAIHVAMWVPIASAQRPPDIQLNAAMNREVVAGIIRAVERFYVSADGAARVKADLERRAANGEYDAITSAFDLMDALDAHLLAATGDPHLMVAYSHRPGEPRPIDADIPPDSPEHLEQDRMAAEANNYGFTRVERLPGNIGLLEISSFERPAFAGETAQAVMTFLAHTDALIIDLRSARGGSPDMVHYLASYFFPGEEPQRLADWRTRVEGADQQLWVLPYLPGHRYLNKDVFVLVSRSTFSAPEGLASLLQHHGRATIVGEETVGGTHPGVRVPVHPHFAVSVPVSIPVYPAGPVIHPIGRPVYTSSEADEKGTGVKPDIAAKASEALFAAHQDALKRLIDRNPASAGDLEGVLQQIIEQQAKK